jgi:hypothetical protein
MSCGSPTAPCTRGSTTGSSIYVTCAPAGSDLQCDSHFTNRSDFYICTPVDEVVTADTHWSVSDPSVGLFDPSRPGLLRTVSRGPTEIIATYKTVYDSIGPVAFFLSPGTAPVKLVWLELLVTDEQSKAYLPGADALVIQDGLPEQRCTTGPGGTCFGPGSRLWVFATGPVHIVVSKAGYGSSDTTSTYPTNSTPYQANIALRRN